MKIIETLPGPDINVDRRIFSNGICDWSADGNNFAWSCYNSFVQLLKVSPSPTEDSFQWSLVKTIDTTYEVWSVAFGHQTQRMKQNFHNHGRFRYHIFEDVLATGLANGRIRTWDVNTGSLRLELTDHSGIVRDLHFAPENIFMMISGSYDGTIKFWEFNDDGNMCKTIRTPFSQVYCCRWSPDAQFIAGGGNSLQLCLWRVSDYQLVRKFVGHMNHISKCDFSPDGTMLASSSYDTKIFVWNIETGNMIAEFFHLVPEPSRMFAGGENGAHVSWLSFSPNNISLVSVCETGMVYHWSMDATNQPIDELRMEGAAACSFSKNGQYICVGSSSGRVLVIHPQTPALTLKQMCRNSIRKYLPLNNLVNSGILPKSLQNYVMFAECEAV